MAYDDVILHMGEFGRYQRRVYLLLCLPAISCAFHKLAGVFLGAKVNSRYSLSEYLIIIGVDCDVTDVLTVNWKFSCLRCLLPHEYAENATFHLSQDILNASYPWDNEFGEWSQCLSRNVIGAVNGTIVEKAIGDDAAGGGISRCKQYVYDTSVYISTTTSEVQNNNYLILSSQSRVLLTFSLSIIVNEVRMKIKHLDG